MSLEQCAAPSSKLDAFDIRDVVYKVVGNCEIPASVLTPKNARPGSRPIIVRWHGGGFIAGHRLFAEWIGDWILDLALKSEAILIMPDYRLLPEATGLDILSDVHSFFDWLLRPGNLEASLPDAIAPELESILVTGESAGGWLALQSGFYAPESVRVVIAQYPMVGLRDEHYTGDYEKAIFDPPLAQIDQKILQDYLAGLRGDEVVTSAVPPAREDLFVSMLQQGSFGKFFGDDGGLYPIEVVATLERAPPPTWIMHGKGDSVIPIDGTYKYVERLKERHPGAMLHLSYREGDHGFDNSPPATLEEDWVKEGLQFIGQYWPRR